jgi:hypothetical protein
MYNPFGARYIPTFFQFLESMQVKYDELAKSRGVYIVNACGFDSIPSELGIAFTKKEFPGDLNDVETYLKLQSGPEVGYFFISSYSVLLKGDFSWDIDFLQGAAVHFGTWESAVHGISSSHELGPIRKQLYKTRTPRPSHKVEQK